MSKILVVDDFALARESVARLLEYEGFTALKAKDGKEGLAMVNEAAPDLVLLDLAMPGIGGLEALPLLRAVSPGSKVVVLSGLDPAEVEQHTRAEGASGYLVKGTDLSNLAAFLDAIVREP